MGPRPVRGLERPPDKLVRRRLKLEELEREALDHLADVAMPGQLLTSQSSPALGAGGVSYSKKPDSDLGASESAGVHPHYAAPRGLSGLGESSIRWAHVEEGAAADDLQRSELTLNWLGCVGSWRLVAFGGHRRSGGLGGLAVMQFDPERTPALSTDRQTPLLNEHGCSPVPRVGHCAGLVSSNTLLIFGGLSSGGQLIDSGQCCHLLCLHSTQGHEGSISLSWKRPPWTVQPPPCAYSAMTALPGTLLLFGGEVATRDAHVAEELRELHILHMSEIHPLPPMRAIESRGSTGAGGGAAGGDEAPHSLAGQPRLLPQLASRRELPRARSLPKLASRQGSRQGRHHSSSLIAVPSREEGDVSLQPRALVPPAATSATADGGAGVRPALTPPLSTPPPPQTRREACNDLWQLQLSRPGTSTAQLVWQLQRPSGTPPPPRCRCVFVGVAERGVALLFGGQAISAAGDVLFNDAYLLALTNGLRQCSWTQIRSCGVPPSPRASCAATCVGPSILIVGGRTHESLNDTIIFHLGVATRAGTLRALPDDAMGTWEHVSPSMDLWPSARHGHALATLGDWAGVVMAGGRACDEADDDERPSPLISLPSELNLFVPSTLEESIRLRSHRPVPKMPSALTWFAASSPSDTAALPGRSPAHRQLASGGSFASPGATNSSQRRPATVLGNPRALKSRLMTPPAHLLSSKRPQTVLGAQRSLGAGELLPPVNSLASPFETPVADARQLELLTVRFHCQLLALRGAPPPPH